MQLRIQQLTVSDCVGQIERNYYDWGRVADGPDPEPAWQDAAPEQRYHIARRGYAAYDGWPTQPGDELGLLEAYVSVGVNSRVIAADAMRLVARAETARPLLGALPAGARLEDASDAELSTAAELICLLSAERHIGWAKSTKVLHKKRPDFIPLLDSAVVDFLWKNFPHRLHGGYTVENARLSLALFREMLRVLAAPLAPILSELAQRGFGLSSVRLLDYLLWLGWKPHSGYGRSSKDVWDAASDVEAEVRAREAWEQQTMGSVAGTGG